MVRTAWASARIQVGPSKVNPETFARAMREEGLSLPECFHAGERSCQQRMLAEKKPTHP